MRTLIVGMGEVGQALSKVLEGYSPQIYDPAIFYLLKPDGEFDIMHITFPFSDKFVEHVKEYQEKYKPKYTVIHSTVPVGTTRQVGGCHSPIRGIHPNLEGGIREFIKFIGGEKASEVADYFRRAGLRVVLYDRPEATEALKLFDTLYYGVCIEFAKDVKRFCDEHDLSFHEVYTLANQTYNEGYTALGHPEFVRPVLQPIMKKTGGHCVLQNTDLVETQFTKLIKELNQ